MKERVKISSSLMLVLFITVLLTAFLLFCSEEKPVNGGPRELSPDTFPLAIGVLWTYEVYDSLTQSTDTVIVSIVDTVTDTNEIFATVWKYNRNNSIFTHYVSVAGDTLAIYNDSTAQMPSEHFVYPFTVGQIWTGPEANGDTSWVMETGLISVPAGDFGNGIRIDRIWQRDFEGGGKQSSTWIVPDIGFVYRYLSERRTPGDGSYFYVTNEVWKLIDYDLSTFENNRFPVTIGTQWLYETYDSNSGIYDTLQVIISGIAYMSDKTPALLWEYDYGDWVDSQYVVVAKDRIEFYPDTLVNSLDMIYYEFPLAVGRYWGIETFAPVPEIIEKGTVTVPAGTFHSGFHYVFYGGAFNYYWSVDDWLVPDVGLVSRIKRVSDLGPWATTTWELLSYQIAR